MKLANSLFISLLLFLSVSHNLFAITSPTKASKPLPTLEMTHNKDIVLQETVQEKLAKLPQLKGQAVSAASKIGVITLEGSVENKAQEQAAIKAAYSVPGVKKVKSQLTIKWQSFAQ